MATGRLTTASIAAFELEVADGGWGTEFQKRGGQPGECFEAWNLRQPGLVEEVARAYVHAGSQIILTNSFGASAIALEAHGLHGSAAAINRAAAALSRAAAGDAAFVFGSLGPCGRLVTMGEVDEARLRDAVAEQAQALEMGGADALVLETMADLREVELALEVLREVVTIPYGVSMTFDSGVDGMQTMMGVSVASLVEVATQGGAAFVGANCGRSAEHYPPLVAAFRAICELPLWFKPNAGLPELEGGAAVYRTSPADFAEQAARLVAAGARIVGGCCGTNPSSIRALRLKLSSGTVG